MIISQVSYRTNGPLVYNFRPVQDYFSLYETDKSVTRWGGGGGENPEKTTWHTHKQNLVCVTCD